jgi:hypothetical protein
MTSEELWRLSYRTYVRLEERAGGRRSAGSYKACLPCSGPPSQIPIYSTLPFTNVITLYDWEGRYYSVLTSFNFFLRKINQSHPFICRCSHDLAEKSSARRRYSEIRVPFCTLIFIFKMFFYFSFSGVDHTAFSCDVLDHTTFAFRYVAMRMITDHKSNMHDSCVR